MRWCVEHPAEPAVVERDGACQTRSDARAIEFAALLALRLRGLRMCAHIIGVSVSDTSAEATMAVDSVTANSRNRRPMTPPMKSSGMSTATSDTVSERIVKPICLAPLSAASSGVSPSSM